MPPSLAWGPKFDPTVLTVIIPACLPSCIEPFSASYFMVFYAVLCVLAGASYSIKQCSLPSFTFFLSHLLSHLLTYLLIQLYTHIPPLEAWHRT